MAYKVLYRKYRPDDFDNVVGQEYTVDMLKNAIITGKNAHAYIFTGPRGTGKTSTAKIFAKALNCEHSVAGNPCNKCKSCLSFKDNPDIIEIDAASNNGVDEIRELINNVKLVPSVSKYKVYIIDEVHMLSPSAFNALLLTLEEPPSHVIFILATTDIQAVPITILSRCQRFDFKPIDKKSMFDRLKSISEKENIRITDDAINEIASISAGGMRDALGMLDQLSSNDDEITLDIVSNYFGSVSIKKISDLLTSIVNNDANNLINILGNIKSSGTSYSVFIKKMIDFLRDKAISIKSGSNFDISFENIYKMIFDLNDCLCNVNINIDPYTLIEIVLLKYVSNDTKCKDSLGNNVNDAIYFPGNNLVENTVNNENENTEDINTEDKVEKSKKTSLKKKKDKIIKINPEIRINNTFVDVKMECKKQMLAGWVDFMNYLLCKDKTLISLLADTTILAASPSYALIQSKTSSTNDLINADIDKIEDFYYEFSGNKYKFAAIDEKIWKEEVKKYRFNKDNKIKYNYMDENILDENSNLNIDDHEKVDEPSDDIEKIAKDIFGSYDVE